MSRLQPCGSLFWWIVLSATWIIPLACTSPGRNDNKRTPENLAAGNDINRAQKQMVAGDYKGALESANQAVEHDPDYYLSYANRALIRADLRDYDGARSDYKEMFRLKPDFMIAHLNYVSLLSFLREHDEAIAHSKALRSRYPEATLPKLAHGSALLEAGSFAPAKALIAEAVVEIEEGKNPEEYRNAAEGSLLSVAKRNLARAYANLGKFDSAWVALRQADRHKSDWATRTVRAEILYLEGKPEEAIHEFQVAAAEATPDQKRSSYWIDSLFLLGKAYLKAGDPEAAQLALEKFIGFNPYEPEAYSNLGLAQARLGDTESAMANYDRALEMDPKLSSAFRNRATLHLRSGELDRAIADFDAALQLDPDNTETLYRRAFAKYSLGGCSGIASDLPPLIDAAGGDERVQELARRCR